MPLVDTGADECAFPASFAEILGHNLTSGKQKYIDTGSGSTMAYGHTSRIMIDEYDGGEDNNRLPAQRRYSSSWSSKLFGKFHSDTELS